MTAFRQGKESSQQRQHEEFSEEAVERPLSEPLAALRQRQHEDDLQDRGRDRKHVAVESGEL